MSFRVSALVAAAAVLGLGSLSPAFAQPQPPIKPRYTAFQSVFAPGRPLVANPGQGILGFGAPPGFINPNNPNAPVFLNPNQAAPQAFPGAYGAVDPNLAPTGVVASFNNLGHWYGPRSGYYGHWYPNGVNSGVGVLSSGGMPGYGGSFGGPGGMIRPGASALGTALLGAATVNQFRR